MLNFAVFRTRRFRYWLSERDEGATMIEYGLMVGLIAVVAVVGVTAFGISVQDLFQTSTEQMPSAGQ